MDANKIISSLLVLAVTGLFSTVFMLNQSVSGLATQTAVMQTHNQQSGKEFVRIVDVIDSLEAGVDSNTSRINRLEWKMEAP